MDLSNLQPAEGSRQNDNFRRGRGHGMVHIGSERNMEYSVHGKGWKIL